MDKFNKHNLVELDQMNTEIEDLKIKLTDYKQEQGKPEDYCKNKISKTYCFFL
jgi:spore germination protein GerM